jgi:hypothetical protein
MDSSGSENSFCRRFRGGAVEGARRAVAEAVKGKFEGKICRGGN